MPSTGINSRSKLQAFALASLLSAASILTGCATVAGGNSDARGTALSKSVQGTVYGGQQAVSGATITLYAASAGGYGTASSSILTSPVSTDANGNFGISNDYTCPTNINGDSLVYIVATGGNPGFGSNNSSIAMMAALGSCATLKANASNTFITINEVTTVAASYSLSGFMTSIGSVSSSGTSSANTALQNAFATSNNLANTSAGYALVGVSALGAVSPQAEVNTLANVIAACINSDGSTASGHPCAMLYAATTVNGTAPTNTIQALLNIAHNPAQSVATIFNLTTSTAPFAPTLATSPNDWTMPIVYSSSAISTPQGLAIDAGGNVFIANATNSIGNIAASGGGNTSSTYSSSASFDAPRSIAVSPTLPVTIWVANCGTTCSSSGNAPSVTTTTATGTTQYTGNGLKASYAVAIDGTSNVWIANTFGNSVAELSSAGVAKSGVSGYTVGGLNDPITLAIDASGNAWIANPPANSITKLNSSGAAQSGTNGYTGGGLNYPYGIAIDHSGNAWIANHGVNSLVVLSSSGVVQSGASGYTGAGISAPNAIALDGSGNAWVSNSNNSVSELTASGVAVSGTNGYTPPLRHPNGIAIDGSGNVWISSCGSTCTGGAANPGSVVELIGAAVPVVTPLSIGALNNTLATKP